MMRAFVPLGSARGASPRGAQSATHRSIVFEHVRHGTLMVTTMFDINSEETDDIELAVRVVCPLPDGQWLAACACPRCGKLRELKSGQQ